MQYTQINEHFQKTQKKNKIKIELEFMLVTWNSSPGKYKM